MLGLLPRQLPALSQILEDLGRPAPSAIAKALSCSERSVRRWIATDDAPRAALLALFWLTRWGRSEVDAAAVNDAIRSGCEARALRDELVELRRVVAHLARLGDFGAANDPSPTAPLRVPPRDVVHRRQRFEPAPLRPSRQSLRLVARRPRSRRWAP